LPLAIRDPAFFDKSNELKVRHIQLDWKRRAEVLGLPYGNPNPDPIVMDMKELKISKDQPHIYRLVYLGVEAERHGKGIEFSTEVSRVIWSSGRASSGGTREIT